MKQETKNGIARKAIAAGLGLSMALGAIAPAVALADDSTGNTNLYVTSDTSHLTTPEGAEDENIKVVLPVAINYVADTEGNLTGPSDDVVKIKNNTALGAVHVSKIQTTSESPATVVATAAEADSSDEVYLKVKPGSGAVDSFGAYLTEKAPTAGDWDVEQGGELSLNELTGKIGGFDSLDPVTKSKVATVHWTVAPGTAAQAAAQATRLVIHRVTPNNDMADLVTTRDATSTALGAGYTWKTGDGTVVTNVGSLIGASASGATEITVYGTTSV